MQPAARPFVADPINRQSAGVGAATPDPGGAAHQLRPPSGMAIDAF
jgi:hypothetical protein